MDLLKHIFCFVPSTKRIEKKKRKKKKKTSSVNCDLSETTISNYIENIDELPTEMIL